MRRLGSPWRGLIPVPFPRPKETGGTRFGTRRTSEICMILPRPGGVLLHTKAFYPAGAYRLPTGGVQSGEDASAAASRELREETGLRLHPCRFVFHLILEETDGAEEDSSPRPPARHEERGFPRRFHSLGLLYPASEKEISPADPEERIAGFTECPWEGLPLVIRKLEALQEPWTEWGLFRAQTHRILWRLWQEHPDWFA